MKSESRTTYIPAIDGLRALAVLAVMLCHARFPAFAGGYVGVDLFFVISGYVVALSIQRELGRGGFTLAAFYTRRLKRLAPALYCVMAATFAFALAFCFPEDALDTLKNIGFVALFYSNVYLSKKTGYFDLEASKQALLHTWSLSVEEQFYLLIPLLLVLLYRRALWLRVALLLLLGVASLAWSQHALERALPGAYFLLPTRAFEFLIGMVLAQLHAERDPPTPGVAHDAVLLAGLGLIGWAVFSYRADTPMPGWNALWPCLGAALVLAGVRGARLAARLLDNRLAVYLGRISYVLYLWHWVVLFALWRFQLTSPAWMAGALLLTVALAVPTHHLVEQRLRWVGWGKGKTALLLFLLPVLVLASLIEIGKRSEDFSRFYPGAQRKDYLDSGRTPFKEKRADTCWSKVGVTSAGACTVGAAASPHKAVFWGDSHAYHLIHFVDQLGKQRGLAVHDLTFTMCAPIENSPARSGDPGFQRHAEECRAHGQAVMRHILEHPDIKTVLMSAVWDLYASEAPGPSLHGFMPGEIDRELAATITRLEAAGKRVVLFDDIPILPAELTDCVANKLYLPHLGGARCAFPQAQAVENQRVAAGILARVGQRFPSVGRLHTYDVPCRDGWCYAELDGTSLYAHNDRGHLGLGGSRAYFGAYQRKHPEELDRIFGAAGETRLQAAATATAR